MPKQTRTVGAPPAAPLVRLVRRGPAGAQAARRRAPCCFEPRLTACTLGGAAGAHNTARRCPHRHHLREAARRCYRRPSSRRASRPPPRRRRRRLPPRRRHRDVQRPRGRRKKRCAPSAPPCGGAHTVYTANGSLRGMQVAPAWRAARGRLEGPVRPAHLPARRRGQAQPRHLRARCRSTADFCCEWTLSPRLPPHLTGLLLTQVPAEAAVPSARSEKPAAVRLPPLATARLVCTRCSTSHHLAPVTFGPSPRLERQRSPAASACAGCGARWGRAPARPR